MKNDFAPSEKYSSYATGLGSAWVSYIYNAATEF